jgi:hypothetical protein
VSSFDCSVDGFAKLHMGNRAQIVADGAVRNKKLLTGRVNVSRSAFTSERSGAHSGGNLRVRAFFYFNFLSQE